MLFRNKNGKLEEIKMYDFKNDLLYYTKIMDIKKEQNCKDDIQKIEKNDFSVSKMILSIEETTNNR